MNLGANVEVLEPLLGLFRTPFTPEPGHENPGAELVSSE